MSSKKIKNGRSMICFIFITLLALFPFGASAYDSRINPSPGADEYIIPYSAEDKLALKDLAGLDMKVIEIAKNEIYARHGLIFQHESMNVYFKTKTWYKVDQTFKKSSLSNVEAANVKLLEGIMREPQKLKNAEIEAIRENAKLLEAIMRDPQKLQEMETEQPAISASTLKAEVMADEEKILKADETETKKPAEPELNAPVHGASINPFPGANEYIIPYSAEKRIAVSDLTGFDRRAIEIAKNEIYARHGLIFQHESMNVYFKTKTWYKVDQTFKKSSLSEIEAANVKLLEDLMRNPQKLKDAETTAIPSNVTVPVNEPKSDADGKPNPKDEIRDIIESFRAALREEQSAEKETKLKRPLPSPQKTGKNQKASKGELIVATAKAQIGKPYRYGSADPARGFDCSGLVNWVYKQYGISTPRSTPDLQKVGVSVPPSQLKPGDIVITRNRRRRDSPHGLHAGIYAGNGEMIHAPGRRRNVIKVKMTYFNIKEGRRVI